MNRYLRRVAAVAATLMISGGIMYAASPEAHAYDRCLDYVVDDANIFQGKKDEVAAAAKSLENVGAEGRAITIQSYGTAGSIDTYIDQMARSCPSWQMSGTLKQNFFAIVISMQERKTTIYYGKQWKSRFDVEAPRIQSGVMAPLFKEGQYATGFVKGFDAIKNVIDAPAAPSGGNVNPGPSDGGTSQSTISAGAFWSVVGIIFGSLLGIALLVWLIVSGIVPWVRRRRESKRLREEAIALQKQYFEEMAALKTSTGDEKLGLWFEDFSVVGGERQVQARTAQTHVQDGIREAEAEGNRAETLADSEAQLTDEIYEDIIAAYSSALGNLNDAREQLASLEDLHKRTLVEANDAADAVADLDAVIANANTALLGLQQSELDTSSLGEKLEAARQSLAQYHELRDAAALVLINELPRLTARVTECETAIEDCQKGLATCKSMLESLPALHQAAIDKRVPAGEAFQRMSQQYAPSSWENIRGNGSKADKLLFRAKEMLDKVAAEPLKDAAKIDARVQTLAEIERMIKGGADLHDAIVARERNIIEAQQTAAQEIDAAHADIVKAEAYIHQFPKDVDQKLDRSLDEARKYLGNARNELAKDKPNYLVVKKQALLANGAADEIFKKAASQHEYLESVRRQLASSRSLFATSSDKSARYINDHSSDVSSEAGRLLEKARDKFARVDKESDEVRQLAVAKEALELANSAYESASRDVAAAEEERAAIRRERERQEREAREERERQERAERERREAYYHSTISSSSSSYSAPSFSSSDFGGSSGGSGW